MIFILNILIDLLLIFCIWKLLIKLKSTDKYALILAESFLYARGRNEKRGKDLKEEIRLLKNAIKGTDSKMYISAKIAEKTADRAFNMASTANLGVIALQKSLATPRLLTKNQATRNGLAKKEVDELFSNDGALDWLYPVASDEEREVLDKIREEKQKKVLKDN